MSIPTEHWSFEKPEVGEGDTAELWADNLDAIDDAIQHVHDDVDSHTHANINHNDTLSKQGGTANQYYHLTSTQHTELTDGGYCSASVHKHDVDEADLPVGYSVTNNFTEGTLTYHSDDLDYIQSDAVGSSGVMQCKYIGYTYGSNPIGDEWAYHANSDHWQETLVLDTGVNLVEGDIIDFSAMLRISPAAGPISVALYNGSTYKHRLTYGATYSSDTNQTPTAPTSKVVSGMWMARSAWSSGLKLKLWTRLLAHQDYELMCMGEVDGDNEYYTTMSVKVWASA